VNRQEARRLTEGTRTLQGITTVIAVLGFMTAIGAALIDVGVQSGQIHGNKEAVAQVDRKVDRIETHHREDTAGLKQHIDKQFEALRDDIRAMNARGDH